MILHLKNGFICYKTNIQEKPRFLLIHEQIYKRMKKILT